MLNPSLQHYNGIKYAVPSKWLNKESDETEMLEICPICHVMKVKKKGVIEHPVYLGLTIEQEIPLKKDKPASMVLAFRY